MAFNNSLLTQFLADCNVRFTVDNGVVSFEYENRYFLGAIRPTAAFDASLLLILPGIQEVKPFDIKNYLKYINQLNGQVPVAKFVLDEQDNTIYIEAEIPLDSSPELDDLVPGLVGLLVDAYNVFHNIPQQQAMPNSTSYNTPQSNEPSIASMVKALIADQLAHRGVTEAMVTDNVNIVYNLGADDLDCVELIMRLEKELGINIPSDFDDASKFANQFHTVKDLISYIEQFF